MKTMTSMLLKNLFSILILSALFLFLMPFYVFAECEDHPADDKILYDWRSCVPETLNKLEVQCILVIPQFVTEDYYKQKTAERLSGEILIKAQTPYSDYTSKFITLSPYLCSRTDPWLNAPYFPREVFDPSIGEFYYRPDLKLNLMIDSLKDSLKRQGYLIHEKVILDGFSGGAVFSSRYSILNPSRVEGVILGNPGGTILIPENSYNSVALNWQVGINDFQDLTGETFDREAYNNIKQFIYIGSEDAETGLPGRSGLFSEEQIDFLISTFGDISPVMLQNQCNYLKSMGYKNIIFKQYPGFMHDTCFVAKGDIKNFAQSIINSIRLNN